MRKKKRDHMETTEELEASETVPEEESIELADPCNAWAFILGGALNAFCPLNKGHEDDHYIEINIYAEPKSHFKIFWALDSE